MESPNFFLESIVRDKDELQDFEGPLSLILMLLSKNKIEIRDLRIADILDQYLDYLDKMQKLDLDIASEFVQMASQLLYIKTKMLLAGDDKEVSELELLIQSLEQLKAKDVSASVKGIIPELKKASEIGLLYFTKLPEPLPKKSGEYNYRHEPADLLNAMYEIYSRGGRMGDDPTESIASAMPKRLVFSVKDKSRYIISSLKAGKRPLTDLYKECGTKSEIVATFLAILELCSMGSVFISHEETGFVAEFAGGNVEEIIEKIVE